MDFNISDSSCEANLIGFKSWVHKGIGELKNTSSTKKIFQIYELFFFKDFL